MKIKETSFGQAVKEFKKFLSENNLPLDIYWIFTEDVLQKKSEIYDSSFWLKLPLPPENVNLAEKQYEFGRLKNLGMCLSAFALCEDKICCHIIIPKDESDSEFLMMSPEYLKLSIVTNMPKANIVRSELKWMIYKSMSRRFKEGNFLLYLQSKKDLQFSGI